MRKTISQRKGSVLILALWILAFLTVFATTIGLRVRQRVGLSSRLEDRSRLHYITEGAVKIAIAALRADLLIYPDGRSANAKVYRFNNPELFQEIRFDDGVSYVGAGTQDNLVTSPIQYGVVDEERKINLNNADRLTLKRLIEIVSNLPEDEVVFIVESIVDWREIGDSILEGFSSDEYYSSLPHPYIVKDAPFELIEELLLIQGVDEDLYRKLKPFITIYGDGLVNINTAPLEVIMALGVDQVIAEKILLARTGLDGIESSSDDHIFMNPFDVTHDVASLIELEKEELIQIDFLNASGKIKTESYYFSINAYGNLHDQDEMLKIACVYNSKDNIIEYWRENN